MGLRHGAAELRRRACRGAEHPDVGGQRSEQSREPAEPRGPGHLWNRVARGDKDQDVRDAIGQVIEDLARPRPETPLDRHQAIAEIAEPAKRNEGRRP